MKLATIEKDAGLFAKLKLRLMSLVMGGRQAVPDIVPLLFFRPAFFGTSFKGYCERVLRGPSEWTVAEREAMATFVSRANACSFCATIHHEVAVQAGATEPPSAKVAAMCAFLDVLARTPEAIGLPHLEAVRAAGISDAAIEDAIHIASIFSSINRIADSLGFTVPDSRAVSASAKVLLERGYDI